MEIQYNSNNNRIKVIWLGIEDDTIVKELHDKLDVEFTKLGFDKDKKADELLSLIKEVADGRLTKNELLGNREIAIFKDGVTL